MKNGHRTLEDELMNLHEKGEKEEKNGKIPFKKVNIKNKNLFLLN